MSQKNFFEFSFQDFKHFLNKDVEIEDKKVSMRTKQIWQSVYKKGSFEISNLTTLPIELRNKLNNLISLQRPKIINTQTSSDGTIKWLIQLFDGNEVECVYIPEKTRATLCISSQVGCTLNCRFCHTGTQRLVKNLSFAEIVNQVIIAKEQIKMIKEISEHIEGINAKIDAMVAARKDANLLSDTEKMAAAYCDKVKPFFDAIRYHSDKLELLVDDEMWTLTKYRELLFTK